MEVPLIDLGNDATGASAMAPGIDRALREVGFMALCNAGVDAAVVASMFATAREFFSRPPARKQRSAHGSAAENFGYQALRGERLDPAKPADLKETFTMRDLLRAPVARERWPDQHFRQVAGGFYRAAMDAALNLQRLLARSLDVPEEFFPQRHTGENVTLRLLHYPPVDPREVAAGQMGAGAHTDYGMLTLLWQDDVGGLQVRDTRGPWHAVPPRPDSATIIEALPGCVDATHPPRFPRTTAGEHLQARIEATHLA